MPIPRGALQSDEIDDLLVTAANPVASDAPHRAQLPAAVDG